MIKLEINNEKVINLKENAKFKSNPVDKHKVNVMIVEDDNDNRELLNVILQTKGYNVKSFGSALKAIEYLKNNNVEIILSDVMMPDMDGIQFCSYVREHYNDIYFILLTAKSDKADIANGLNIGADDYIVKPYDFVELIARVKVGERVVSNQKQLSFLNEELEKIADTDGLTGLKNRRYLETEAAKEIGRAKRYGHTMAFFIIDIDHFKEINDTYGHLAGDYVLKEVSNILTKYVRESDIVCRYGGEEFVLVLPEANPKQAFIMAEKLRKIVEETVFNFQGNMITLTISIGIAIKKPDHTVSFNDLINFADKALYLSKNTGRNKTVMYKWFNTYNLKKA